MYALSKNPDAHVRWTGNRLGEKSLNRVVWINMSIGPQLLKQLPNISVFCAGMGTAGTYTLRSRSSNNSWADGLPSKGTMTGIGQYLKQNKDSIIRVGLECC